MHIQVNGTNHRYAYRFIHEPEWKAQKGERPRGAYGRTGAIVSEIKPDPRCERHTAGSGDCTCQKLQEVTAWAYCSKKEPEVRAEWVATGKLRSLGALVVIKGNGAYDPIYGRGEAFRKAMADPSLELSDVVRKGLWHHFLTTCYQAIDVAPQPGRRIYKRFIDTDLNKGKRHGSKVDDAGGGKPIPRT